MAVNIIIRTLLSFFAVGIVMMLFMPIVYELGYNIDAWDDVSTELKAARDNMYSMFLLIPVFAIGGILLWAYMASTRKSQDEFV
jgi:hypothetical protein